MSDERAVSSAPLWARRMTLSGPPEDLDERQITIAASFFRHFSDQPGHAGGHVLVDRKTGTFCATSFWSSLDALEATMSKTQTASKRLSETIWQGRGECTIQVFEVMVLKPASEVRAAPTL